MDCVAKSVHQHWCTRLTVDLVTATCELHEQVVLGMLVTTAATVCMMVAALGS